MVTITISKCIKAANKAIKEKDFSAAIVAVKEGLKLDENNYSLLLIGGVANTNLKEFDSAEIMLHLACKIDSTGPNGFQGLMELYIKAGKLIQATDTVFKLIEIKGTQKCRKHLLKLIHLMSKSSSLNSGIISKNCEILKFYLKNKLYSSDGPYDEEKNPSKIMIHKKIIDMMHKCRDMKIEESLYLYEMNYISELQDIISSIAMSTEHRDKDASTLSFYSSELLDHALKAQNISTLESIVRFVLDLPTDKLSSNVMMKANEMLLTSSLLDKSNLTSDERNSIINLISSNEQHQMNNSATILIHLNAEKLIKKQNLTEQELTVIEESLLECISSVSTAHSVNISLAYIVLADMYLARKHTYGKAEDAVLKGVRAAKQQISEGIPIKSLLNRLYCTLARTYFTAQNLPDKALLLLDKLLTQSPHCQGAHRLRVEIYMQYIRQLDNNNINNKNNNSSDSDGDDSDGLRAVVMGKYSKHLDEYVSVDSSWELDIWYKSVLCWLKYLQNDASYASDSDGNNEVTNKSIDSIQLRLEQLIAMESDSEEHRGTLTSGGTDSCITMNSYHLGLLYWARGASTSSTCYYRTNTAYAFTCFLRVAKDGSFKNTDYQATAFQYIGLYYLDITKDAQRAKKCFIKSLSMYPALETAGERLCALYMEEGRVTLVRSVYKTAIDYQRSALWAWKGAASLHYNSGDYNEATQMIHGALRITSQDAYLWELLGECYLKTGKFTAALKSLTRAVGLGPCRYHSYSLLGSVNYQMNEFQNSLDSYKTSLELKPNYIPALKGIASTYLAFAIFHITNNQYGRAGMQLKQGSDFAMQASKLLGNSYVTHKLLGDIATTAVQVSTSAFKLTMDNHFSCNGFDASIDDIKTGSTLQYEFVKSGNKAYSKALHMSPWLSDAWFDAGVNLYHTKTMLQSYNQYESQDDTVEKNYYDTRLQKTAERMIHTAIIISPLESSYWNAMGVLSENPSKIQHCLIRSIQLDNNPSAWNNLGMFYIQQNQLELATQALRTSQCLNPASGTMWFGHGIIKQLHERTHNPMDSTMSSSNTYAAYLCALDARPPLIARLDGGISALEGGHGTIAEYALGSYIQLNQHNPYAYYILGMVLECNSKYVFADTIYRRSLSLLNGIHAFTISPGRGHIGTGNEMLKEDLFDKLHTALCRLQIVIQPPNFIETAAYHIERCNALGISTQIYSVYIEAMRTTLSSSNNNNNNDISVSDDRKIKEILLKLNKIEISNENDEKQLISFKLKTLKQFHNHSNNELIMTAIEAYNKFPEYFFDHLVEIYSFNGNINAVYEVLEEIQKLPSLKRKHFKTLWKLYQQTDKHGFHRDGFGFERINSKINANVHENPSNFIHWLRLGHLYYLQCIACNTPTSAITTSPDGVGESAGISSLRYYMTAYTLIAQHQEAYRLVAQEIDNTTNSFISDCSDLDDIVYDCMKGIAAVEEHDLQSRRTAFVRVMEPRVVYMVGEPSDEREGDGTGVKPPSAATDTRGIENAALDNYVQADRLRVNTKAKTVHLNPTDMDAWVLLNCN